MALTGMEHDQTSSLPTYYSDTITLPEITPQSSATITTSIALAGTPLAVMILDNTNGRPYIVTNWWVSNGILKLQIYNCSNYTEASHNVKLQYYI